MPAIPTVAPRWHVAPLTAADVPGYRRLMLDAYEYAADAFTSTADERAAEDTAWWVKRIGGTGTDSVAFGAFEGAELAGTVALEFSTKRKILHKAHVIGMYVGARYRGQGLGKALLEAAIAHATARGDLRTMVLTVTAGNASAIALYEALGFVAFGTEPMAIRTPEGFKAKVHMWKRLAGDAEPLPQGTLP